jgi:hypothetical protein
LEGDGGYAFFYGKPGQSVAAAISFIDGLDRLTQQTCAALRNRFSVQATRRSFRVKAHFTVVHFDRRTRKPAAWDTDLMSFVKNERDLAEFGDEVYVTEQLKKRLPRSQQKKFELAIETKSYGELTTSMWRRKREPNRRARKILDGAVDSKDLTSKEWAYLKGHLHAQKINAAARNSIATALTQDVASKASSALSGRQLTKLTLEMLYNYLRSVTPKEDFRLSLWRPEKAILKKAFMYPLRSSTQRSVNASDRRYAVVQTFQTGQPIVIPSIVGARHEKMWQDLDPATPAEARSTLQLPIYRSTDRVAIRDSTVTLAVLSVHADRPDFFLRQELALWIDDLAGFLAYLALAESLQKR